MMTAVRGREMVMRALPSALVLVGFGLLYRSIQERGHDWGDDFSLYINQARGLVRGDVGRVAADTRYALDNSGWSSFGPTLYPWGFPILLAPLVVLGGIDYELFKLLQTACLCVALLCFHRLLVRRLPPVPAIALVLVVALSVPYAWWTNSVTSDFPSLCFVFVTLVWIDRCRERVVWEAERRGALVVLGLLLGWTFSIRRESIALLLAVATLQVLHLARAWTSGGRSWPAVRDRRWDRLALPHLVALVLVAGLQLVLPASLTVDKPPGGGLSALWPNVQWYRDAFAEQIGLKDGGAAPLSLFGSELGAKVVLTLIVCFAIIGVVGRLVTHRSRDAHLVVYLVVTSLVVGTQPFHEGRYLFSLTPLLLYFAYQGLPVLVAGLDRLRRARTERFARLVAVGAHVPLLLVAPLLVANADDFAHAVDYHHDVDYVIDGPETVSSQEMFAAVQRCTRGDEVVLFARARAMNLYTGRRSIQTGGTDQALQRADWLVLANSSVDYSEPPIAIESAAQLGLERVWHNAEWSLLRVGPDRTVRPACPTEPA
jgi:hypothetical protein